jgi:adenylosuccinate synthase
MSNLAIIGAQWGDEGKGKLVDLLADRFDVVVRFQGGANAGHTVVLDGEKLIMHQVPSGILRPETVCVVGNGVVVDTVDLMSELEMLQAHGVILEGRLRISDRAHLVLPFHKKLDFLQEENRGDEKIGTTCRGIGPAYEFKAGRWGFRVGDLLHEQSLKRKINEAVEGINRRINLLGSSDLVGTGELIAQLRDTAVRLKPFIADTSRFLYDYASQGKRILFEGAQGTMLDIDHGTYPYVTSSNTTIGGICIGTGLPPRFIGIAMGVAKAYATRVGEGPFPSEETGDLGGKIRERGGEFGATTGRPRRCGWFDAVAARYAARVNGLDAVAITKIDVLDGLKEINVCVAYELNGERIDTVPAAAEDFLRCSPVYETVPGWEGSIAGITSYEKMPEGAKRYVDFLSSLLGLPIPIISTGFERRHTVIREEILRDLLS